MRRLTLKGVFDNDYDTPDGTGFHSLFMGLKMRKVVDSDF